MRLIPSNLQVIYQLPDKPILHQVCVRLRFQGKKQPGFGSPALLIPLANPCSAPRCRRKPRESRRSRAISPVGRCGDFCAIGSKLSHAGNLVCDLLLQKTTAHIARTAALSRFLTKDHPPQRSDPLSGSSPVVSSVFQIRVVPVPNPISNTTQTHPKRPSNKVAGKASGSTVCAAIQSIAGSVGASGSGGSSAAGRGAST